MNPLTADLMTPTRCAEHVAHCIDGRDGMTAVSSGTVITARLGDRFVMIDVARMPGVFVNDVITIEYACAITLEIERRLKDPKP